MRNIQIDYVYVQGTSAQGVETYGVDDITIGTVVARDVGESGLLLNDTTNAEVGLVDSINAGAGTGYAAFRTANRNGRINNAYPTNIHVGQVIARTGGRGIFCVSESGGLVIDRIDIANTGNNAILLENCYNVNIAAVSGTVSGGGEIRIAARTEFANTSDIRFQNLTLTSNRITESPCATTARTATSRRRARCPRTVSSRATVAIPRDQATRFTGGGAQRPSMASASGQYRRMLRLKPPADGAGNQLRCLSPSGAWRWM